MSAPIPAGGTWLDTLKRSFVDVPVDAANDNAIATTEFLEAAESLTTLFGTWPTKYKVFFGPMTYGLYLNRCPRFYCVQPCEE